MKRLLGSMKGGHKAALQSLGRKAGLEIRLAGPNTQEDLRLVRFLQRFKVDLVLDVGANRGQFAKRLLAEGFTGRIVSFEVLPEAHAILTAAAAGVANWVVAPRLALSDRPGTAKFHVTAGDSASSLFMPSADLAALTPQARLASTIEVPTERLDNVVRDLGLDVRGAFLKLDVQGSELLVLSGAPDTVGGVAGLLTEMSLSSIYDGQPGAPQTLDLIFDAGFEIWDVWPGYRNPVSHRLDQVDIVCFRAGAPS